MPKCEEKHPGLVVQKTPDEMWREMRRPPGWFVIHEATGKLLQPTGFRRKKTATEFAVFLCSLLDFMSGEMDIQEEVNRRELWPQIHREFVARRDRERQKR